MVVIYEGVKDFPDMRFIARTWRIAMDGSTSGEIIATSNDLQDCRQAALAQGCDVRFIRSPEDDPTILETWI